MRWAFTTGREVPSSPAIGADGTVYVGSYDKKVYALDGATGQKRWEFTTGGAVASCPAIGADGTVYVGSYDKKVYALDGATGQKRWEFTTGAWVESSPAIGADGTVYVGSYDRKVYALDGATGQKRWEFVTGGGYGSSSPAIGADGTVYVGSYDRKVYALDGATGQKRWEFTTGSYVYSSPAIGADGTVYVGSWDKKVYALDGATGQKRWEFTTGREEVYSSPAIGADGTVYVGSYDRKLYALYSSSVGGLARSPWPKFRGNAQNTGQRSDQPPRFGTQPSVRFFREGAEGRLTVQVSGAPMPQMQWYFGGAIVAGGTNATLNLTPVTRAMGGAYWLVASNVAGQATSAPIAVVVSNVDLERFVAFRWPAHTQSKLALQSADAVGGPWSVLSNYPPASAEQRFIELAPRAAGFYRLVTSDPGPVPAPVFTGAGLVKGWVLDGAVGTKHLIEYVAASTAWTNWQVLTNLTLPASPYLFLDYDSLSVPVRVYRTTPVP
jgi:hypothetical protein